MNLQEEPDWSKTLAAVAGVVVLAALVLLGMGRTMWGAAEGFGLWSGDIDSKFNSQRLTDPYTFSHISHGLVFFLLLSLAFADRLAERYRMVVAVVLEGVWEVVENTPMVIDRFRETTIAQGYYGDSVLNSVGDVMACAVGFAIAIRLTNRWWVLGLFALLEGLLAVWIRDIIMLVYPIPGLREWQAG